MINTKIKIGTIVQLWTTAANYGIVTKINKKTFAVTHNANGRHLFRFDSLSFKDYYCINNVHRCSVVDIGLKYAAKQLNDDYIFNRLSSELKEIVIKRLGG